MIYQLLVLLCDSLLLFLSGFTVCLLLNVVTDQYNITTLYLGGLQAQVIPLLSYYNLFAISIEEIN